MKKLSLLVALILCVTIGGVYATWNYSRYTVDSKQATATVVITGTQSSAKGIISIVSAPKRLIIDDTNNDLEAELWFGDIDADSHPIESITDQDGKIEISFAHNQGADQTVIDDGIAMKWTLSASSLGSYKGAPIFEITQTEGTFNGGQATKSTSINIGDYIKLADTIKLSTYAEYLEFEEAISGISFTLIVSEITSVGA